MRPQGLVVRTVGCNSIIWDTVSASHLLLLSDDLTSQKKFFLKQMFDAPVWAVRRHRKPKLGRAKVAHVE